MLFHYRRTCIPGRGQNVELRIMSKSNALTSVLWTSKAGLGGVGLTGTVVTGPFTNTKLIETYRILLFYNF